jgi:tetratricopeptide (TPR) repeat protein
MRFAGSHHHILSLLVYDNHQLRDKVHSLGRLRKTFSFPIFCFFELNQTQFIKTPLFPSTFKGMVSKSSSFSYLCSQLTSSWVVEESSACLAGDERSHLQADHINLNKYSGPDDRSFLSVSAEIMRMCNIASHMANTADPKNITPMQKGHWVVPFDQNAGFVGRDDILPDLLVRLSPDCQKNSCQRTVVEGLGGIGKSQIALEAAFRLRDLDPTCSVFWVSALSVIAFENAYRDIARKLGIQLPDGESSNILPIIKQALSNEAIGKWLLIVDNADDPSLMFGPGSLESHLPSGPHGSILFTTRTSEVTNLLDVPSMQTFRIEAMSPQEAADLMGTRLSTSQMEDVESFHALLELLCHLPLALKQAAAYMQLHRLTPKDYTHRCQSSDKGLIRLLSRGFGDRTRYGDAQHPVAKTWLISFVHLSSNNPLASQYLEFMSFLSEKNIPLSILPPEDEIEVQEAIGVLQSYGFVTVREDREYVDMHRLVRLAIRNWLEDRGGDKESYEHVQARMLVLFGAGAAYYGNQAEWARYIPHCHAVVDEDALSTSAQATWRLLAVFSVALVGRGMHKAALDLSRRAKSLSMDIHDPNDLHQIISISIHTALLIAFGHHNEAEEILREILPRLERLFGKHHQATLNSRRHLGILLLECGKYKELEQMNRELLQEAERDFGKRHEQTIMIACDLCDTLLVLKRYKEAEKMARQFLVQSRSILRDQQFTMFRIILQLADSLIGLQQFQEAEELTRQAIKTAETMLGKEHPTTLSITGYLARILDQSGQIVLAEELSRKLVKTQERILGKENPDTLQSAEILAATLCGLGRFLEAEGIFQDNLQAYQRLYGEECGETILSAINLGSFLRLAGKHREAAELLQQTAETSSKVFGEGHTYTTRCLEQLNLIPYEFHPARSDPESHSSA